MKKTKKILSGITAVCLMGAMGVIPENIAPAVSMTASAEEKYTEGTYEQFTYKNYGDYIEIYDFDESATDIVIPSEIDGTPVKIIGYNAFRYCDGLVSVVIPEGVTDIAEYAFRGCESLKSVTFPESVKNIGEWAFFNTPWLDAKIEENPLVIVNDILIDGESCEGDVVIPDGIKSISGNAFLGCKGLTSVEIPESVENIGMWAFDGTPWLDEKRAENPLVVVNNFLIDGTACEGDVVIPDGVEVICAGAFYECGLTSAEIPESVKNIGDWAFYSCENLNEIKILNAGCEIYDDALVICNSYKGYETFVFTGTIYGYDNSTAQEYAKNYGRKFRSLGQAPEKDLPLGDIDGDGLINAVDSTAVLVEYAELSTKNTSTLSENQQKSADVNNDGAINAVDATIISQYYAYISTDGTIEFPEFIENLISEA